MKIQKARNEEEKNAVFGFFKNMWEEEFNLEVTKEKELKNLQALFALHKNTMVAALQYAPMNEETLRLGRIGVLKAFRKQDLGRKLMKVLLKEIERKNIKKVELTAEKNSIDFYKKFGFKEDGEPCIKQGVSQINMIKICKQ